MRRIPTPRQIYKLYSRYIPHHQQAISNMPTDRLDLSMLVEEETLRD